MNIYSVGVMRLEGNYINLAVAFCLKTKLKV